ncbi:MAG TPA: membrane protein insertion efficiency factor YidD, partial [Candidatus Acidoferrum sp.]|nr:membrane protein insertion efficiency factor YidD [Candidatus Acidoferrum sp.]
TGRRRDGPPTRRASGRGAVSSGDTAPSRAVRVALALLNAYQAASSGRVSPCRFYPSCSNYAKEAFGVHGFWRGLALTARRLARCRPFGPHGVDLVPVPARGHLHGPDGGLPC